MAGLGVDGLGKVETLPNGDRAWAFARGQNLLLTLAAYLVFAPIIFYFLFDYAGQLIEPAAGQSRNWVFLFPIAILSVFALALLAGIPGTIFLYTSKRPYLLLDSEGVKVRETGDLRHYLQIRTVRWSEIDNIGLSPDLARIQLRLNRAGKTESLYLYPSQVGAEPAALIETLEAERVQRAGRRVHASVQGAGASESRSTETREWRVSPTVSRPLIIIAPIGVLGFSVFIWQAVSSMLPEAPQGLHPELLFAIALFAIVPLYPLTLFVKLWISVLLSRADDSPRLRLDLIGLHQSEFTFRALGLSTRTVRWSDIEAIELTRKGPLLQPKRLPDKIRLRVREDGSMKTMVVDPFSLLGEDRETLERTIEAAWRARTGRAAPEATG